MRCWVAMEQLALLRSSSVLEIEEQSFNKIISEMSSNKADETSDHTIHRLSSSSCRDLSRDNQDANSPVSPVLDDTLKRHLLKKRQTMAALPSLLKRKAIHHDIHRHGGIYQHQRKQLSFLAAQPPLLSAESPTSPESQISPLNDRERNSVDQLNARHLHGRAASIFSKDSKPTTPQYRNGSTGSAVSNHSKRNSSTTNQSIMNHKLSPQSPLLIPNALRKSSCSLSNLPSPLSPAKNAFSDGNLADGDEYMEFRRRKSSTLSERSHGSFINLRRGSKISNASHRSSHLSLSPMTAVGESTNDTSGESQNFIDIPSLVAQAWEFLRGIVYPGLVSDQCDFVDALFSDQRSIQTAHTRLNILLVLYYISKTVYLFSLSYFWDIEFDSSTGARWFASASLIAWILTFYALQGKSYTVWPLYYTGIPFLVYVFIISGIETIARRVSMFIWVMSLRIVFLQSGHPCLCKYMMPFMFSMFFVYFGSIQLSRQLCLSNGLHDSFCTSTTQPINWPVEVISIMATAISCSFTYTLQRFVKQNALSYLQRLQEITQLEKHNAKLEEQLRRYQSRAERQPDDFVAPLISVIATLQELKKRCLSEKDHDNVDNNPKEQTEQGVEEVLDSINHALTFLTGPQLFKPIIEDSTGVDQDVRSWLQTVIKTHSAEKELKNSSPALQPRASLDLLHFNDENFDRETEKHLPGENLIVKDILRKVGSPDFNVFELSRHAPGKVLTYTTLAVLQRHNLIKSLNIDLAKLKSFLSRVESSYQANPYHSADHAADVVAMMHYFLKQLKQKIHDTQVRGFSDEEIFGAILACAIHDVAHPGFNNAFLIQTHHPIATRYNDRSVLENFHLAFAFDLLTSSDNFLSKLSTESFKVIRDVSISCVLATDMAMHFEYIARFQNKIMTTGIDWTNANDRKLLLVMATKASDINNAAKPTLLSLLWTEAITEEFFRQGDEEKRLGLPVSAFMDRENSDVAKSQQGFIDYVVLPLYEPWIEFLGGSSTELLNTIRENRLMWQLTPPNLSPTEEKPM